MRWPTCSRTTATPRSSARNIPWVYLCYSNFSESGLGVEVHDRHHGACDLGDGMLFPAALRQVAQDPGAVLHRPGTSPGKPPRDLARARWS
jgi:hypothetical protein